MLLTQAVACCQTARRADSLSWGRARQASRHLQLSDVAFLDPEGSGGADILCPQFSLPAMIAAQILPSVYTSLSKRDISMRRFLARTPQVAP